MKPSQVGTRETPRETPRGPGRDKGMTLPRPVLPGTTYLLTRRCIGRRFLLKPDPALNNLFIYCLGLAVEKHGFQLHAVSVMSNHYHLVTTDVRGVLPDFLMALNRNLAMCIKRLREWDEVVWEPNVATSAVELSGTAEILAYTLLNPVSAGLVRAPQRWPGVVSTLEQLGRGTLEATRPPLWFKDTAPKKVKLRWTTPPGFGRNERYLAALQSLTESRLRELRAESRRQGRDYLGRPQVMKTQFIDQPRTKKARFGRSPTFSALTRQRWLKAMKRLLGFRRAYRAAYQAWRNGDLRVTFPRGTWWMVRYAGAAAVT